MEFIYNNRELLKKKLKYNNFKTDLKLDKIEAFKKSKKAVKSTIME